MGKNKKVKCDDPKKPKPAKPKHTIKKNNQKCKKFRPTRNINGFIFFTLQVRKYMQEKGKGKFKQTDVTMRASQCWHKLTNKQKEDYAEKAKGWSRSNQKKRRCPTCGRP